MIKDIVVNLSVGEKASPACDYAVSVAAAFDAHLAGIAFLFDPIVPVSGAGYIPADVIDAQERDNEKATRAALDHFNAACSRAGVSAEPLTLSASFGGVEVVESGPSGPFVVALLRVDNVGGDVARAGERNDRIVQEGDAGDMRLEDRGD